MKKIEYFVNNVDHVEDKLKLRKDIKRVKINTWFCEDKLKEFVKKIPRFDDKEAIEKLEQETGIILKYYVFYDKYGFYEYTKLGIWPDNDAVCVYPDGRKGIDIHANYLDNFDVLVVDRISNMKEGN